MKEMIFFPDQPDFDPISDTIYDLRMAYSYTTLSGVVIYVPQGFHSDGLSAPRATWTIIGMPPDGLYRAAACIHDFLYATGGGEQNFTRKQSDDILLEIMTRLGISYFQRKSAYLAVRLFGGSHWKDKTK
jgi:hypothetical protein